MAIKCNLSEIIPSNAIVIDALFEIYREGHLSESYYDQSGTYSVHAMEQKWNEDTWELGVPLIDNSWGDVHYAPAALDSSEYKQYTTSETGWHSFDIINAFLKSSIEDISEKGFLLLSKNEHPFWGSGGRAGFASSDSSSDDLRPKLTIIYKTPL